MSKSYGVVFGSDTTGFKKGIGEVKNELNNLNKKLIENQSQQKSVNKTISELEKEIKKAKTELGTAQKAHEELTAKIKAEGSATEEEKKQLKELEEQIKKNNTTIDENNKKISENQVKLSALKTDQAELRQEISNTSKELTTSNEQWTVLKGTIANLSSEALTALGHKLAEIGKSVLDVGMNFTSSMSEVKSISGATAEEAQKLEDAAREAGSTTKYTASESAQALKYMALAGWDVQQSLDGLPGILNLAASSGTDLATASDMVTDYLSAFGMQAQDSAYMVDLLSYAQNNANTTAVQMGDAWHNSAANMHTAGQTIETTTALIATMSNQGLKGAEAGTALAAMLRDITQKMEDGKIQIGKTAVTVQDANGNFRDMTDILADVQTATNGMGTAEKSAALMSTFTARSIRGVNLVLNAGTDSVKSFTEQLQGASGTATEAAEVMEDNLAGDVKKAQSAFEELALKIYDSGEGPLRDLVQTITRDGVPAIEALINNLDTLIPIVVAAASAMGAYKAAVAIQSIINGVTAGIQAMTSAKVAETAATEAATAAQVGLNTAQAANPIGLVVGAIAALVAGLGALAITSSNATAETKEFTEAQEAAKKAAEDCANALQSAEEKYASSIGEADKQAAMLKKVTERYEELRKKTELTASEQYQMDSAVKQLSKTLGVSAESLKDKEGKYISLTDKVDAYIRKLKEQAEVEAVTELYGDAVKAATAAEVSWETAVEKLQEFQDAHGGLDNMGSWGSDVWEQYSKLQKSVDDLADAHQKAEDTVSAYADKVDALSNKEDYLTTRVGGSNDAIAAQARAAKKAAEALSDLGDAADDDVKDTETLNKELEQYNKSLETNTARQRSLNIQIAEYERTGNSANDKLRDAQKELKSLQDEETTLRDNIRDTRFELKASGEQMELFTDNSAELLKVLNDDYTTLEALQNEVNTTGKISLGTLQSISSKYPELNNLVQGYIQGIRTEADVIAGLKSVYDTDVKNYQNALKQKLSEDSGFYTQAVNSNAGLVNEFKKMYGIDLKNFTQATAAKKALLDALEAKIEEARKAYDKIFENYTVGVDINTGNAVYYDKNGRRLSDAEVKKINSDREAYFKAQDDYRQAEKKFDELLKKLAKSNFEGVTVTPSSSGSTKSSGSTSSAGSAGSTSTASTSTAAEKPKTTYYVSSTSGGHKYTGQSTESYIKALFELIDTMQSLDELSDTTARKWIQDYVDKGGLSEDEWLEAKKRIKAYNKAIADEEQKAESERQRAAEEAAKKKEEQRTKALQDYYDYIDNEKAFDRMSLYEEHHTYTEMLKKLDLTESEKNEILKKRYNVRKQMREQEQREIEENIRKENEARQAQIEQYDNQLSELSEYLRAAMTGVSDRMKTEADAEIAALDEELQHIDDLEKKHKQEQEDSDLQKQLDDVNARLKMDNDTTTRLSLERQRDELQKQQSELQRQRAVEAERNRIEAQKVSIQQTLNNSINALNDSVNEAITGLKKLQSGGLTASERAAQAIRNNNLTLLINGARMSADTLDLNSLLNPVFALLEQQLGGY